MPIERASRKNDAKLRASPLNFPDGSTLNFDGALLSPSLVAFLIDFDILITACSCNTFPSPIKAQVMNNDTGWKLSDNVDLVFLYLHFGGLIIKIMILASIIESFM